MKTHTFQSLYGKIVATHLACRRSFVIYGHVTTAHFVRYNIYTAAGVETSRRRRPRRTGRVIKLNLMGFWTEIRCKSEFIASFGRWEYACPRRKFYVVLGCGILRSVRFWRSCWNLRCLKLICCVCCRSALIVWIIISGMMPQILVRWARKPRIIYGGVYDCARL